MELSAFIKILDKHLGGKIPVDLASGKPNQANSLNHLLYSFVYFDDKEETDMHDYFELDDNFAKKIYEGHEKLPKTKAQKIIENFSTEDFEDFIGYPCFEKEAIIQEFYNYGIEITYDDFVEEIGNTLKTILFNLVSNEKKPSIKEASIEGNRVRVKNKYINLPPELVPTSDPTNTEQTYVEALLEVYAQAEHIKHKITVDDLKTMNKEYEAHFRVQRRSYYAAASLLRKIRDTFSDGENEFVRLKDEIFAGIEDELIKTQINAYARVKHVLHFVVTDLRLTKAYLGKDTSEWTGAQEKKGIIHILVNDGKVVWINDYDTDI